MRRKITLFAVVLPLFAQTSIQDPIIRVSIDLVQVDAVVTDSQGRHVADLKREDFEILEDGKPQKITHFSYVDGGIAKPPGAPVEFNLTSAQRPRPEDVRRTIVLVADDLSYGTAEFARVRSVMKDFIDRLMQPGDLVSIMTTSGGMGALERLTSDKRALYAAIDRIVFSPGRNQFGWSNGGDPPYDAASRYAAAADEALAADRRRRFAPGATSALGYAIQALRGMPGRKAVALFSAGFAGAAAPVIEMANRSSVVLYTFDMRGIVATYDAHLPAGFWASQGSMNLLAKSTGGIFFHETNAFAAALATALDDMSSYYLLGYQPPGDDFGQVRGNAQFHRIQVRVLRPGLQVRSRDGFAGVPDPPANRETGPGEELRKALDSPFRGSSLPLNLSAFYSASTGGLHTTLRALLIIDARGLKPQDIADGRKRLVLDVLAGIWGGNEKPLNIVDREFTIEKTQQELENGLGIEIDVPVAKAGAYQVRAAVRDADSGQTGSATAFAEVPDFKRTNIALSSVILSDNDPARTAALEARGVLGAGNPAVRAFAPGATLTYECDIFGTHTEKASGKPDVAVEVHLFRGPERIFTGHRIVLPVETPANPIRAAGTIKLPDFLPSGDYALELIAYDGPANPGRTRASQWIDFTLVK
jgi:VWFA-related protein